MTAIVATVAHNGAWLSSDTLVVDTNTGEALGYLRKLLILNRAQSALVVTGSLGAVTEIYSAIYNGNPSTFRDVDTALADILPRYGAAGPIRAFALGITDTGPAGVAYGVGPAGLSRHRIAAGAGHALSPAEIDTARPAYRAAYAQWDVAARGEGVEGFHRSILRCMRSASLKGMHGPSVVVGGMAETARITAAGIKLSAAPIDPAAPSMPLASSITPVRTVGELFAQMPGWESSYAA
jgi:hypothetical protein